MCYSSRSSGAWIALADSTVFIPENSPTFENEKEHFEEPRWNDGYYRGAKSIDGQQQCFEKLQERKPWSDSSCISTQTHMPILFRHPPIAAQGHGEKSLGESSQENKQFRCPSSVNVLVFGLWEETFTHTHTHTQKGGGGLSQTGSLEQDHLSVRWQDSFRDFKSETTQYFQSLL